MFAKLKEWWHLLFDGVIDPAEEIDIALAAFWKIEGDLVAAAEKLEVRVIVARAAAQEALDAARVAEGQAYRARRVAGNILALTT